MPRSRPWLPYAALTVTLVLWASAFVAIRHLGEDFSPGALSLGRQTVAALALGALVLVQRPAWPRRRDWPSLVVIGTLWFAVYHVALNEAEQRVDAGTAAMLLQMSPLLLTVLAVVFLGERATGALVLGLLVALGGVVLIGLATSEGANGDLVGILLCLVACLAYAVSVVLQKPLLVRVPPVQLTWLACVIGALVTVPFAGTLAAETAAAPASSVFWLIFLGLFPTAIAFTTWAYALRQLSASTMGVSTYLVPPITVLIAWIALAETPPFLAYVGGALCLLGVGLTRRAPKRPVPAVVDAAVPAQLGPDSREPSRTDGKR